MNNSKRFLDAYNRTDSALHARFGFKPSMSFSDAVRRAAAINSVVRKYENDLIDYGRLRNAIVHKSDSDKAIAEPHDDVTENFEHIANILSEPPRASSIAHVPVTVSPNTPIAKAIERMNERDFSIMPVTDGKQIIGVFTNKNVVGFVANNMGGLDEVLATAKVEDAISDSDVYYAVMNDGPVDDVLFAFEKNRKLRMVILTDGGGVKDKIIGIITVTDLVTISKMLDPY